MSTTTQPMRTVTGDGLVVHLKLDSVRERDEKATVPDSSGNNNEVIVHGKPKLVPDKRFGSCLRFDPPGVRDKSALPDYLKLQRSGDVLKQDWTFSSWIYFDPNAEAGLVFLALASDQDRAIIIDFDKYLLLDHDGQELQSRDKVALNKWVHVAVGVQANGKARLWVDGKPSGEREMPVLPQAADLTVTIGSYEDAPVDEGFTGKMAHVRLYDKTLTTEDIQRQLSLDQSPVLDFRVSSPLDFELWDEQKKSAIYVEGGEISHKLTVPIWNRDPKKRPVVFGVLPEKPLEKLETIKTLAQLTGHKEFETIDDLGRLSTLLEEKDEKQKRPELGKRIQEVRDDPESLVELNAFLGLKGENRMQKIHQMLDDFFTRQHHLELRFPKGTLSRKACTWMRGDLDRLLAKKEALGEGIWYIHYQDHPELNSESIYLLSPEERALEAGNVASEAPALEIVLPHIAAGAEAEAQVLPVELRPGPLAKRSDGASIVGSRICTAEVLSQRGQKYIPLHFDVIGSNTVLNDGLSETALLLRITNVDREVSIPIDRKGNRQTRFILACEITDRGGHQEWALTDEPKKVKAWVHSASGSETAAPDPDKKKEDPNFKTDWPGDPIISSTNGRMVEWVIDGDQLGTDMLKPNDSVYLRLEVQTGLRSGPSDIHLHYRHIPGYWDGSRSCTIQKSPLIFHHQGPGLDYVGIGTNKPASKLSVTDGLTIGGIWANHSDDGLHTAPANGLLVQGHVGIGGVPAENTSLHVKRETAGSTARFEGGHGVAINGVTGAATALKVHDNSTSEPTLWVGNKGTGAVLHVKQEGAGSAASFEGGAGVAIHRVTGAATALKVHDNSTSEPTLWVGNNGDGATLHVKQKGAGNAASFEGGAGVDITGVTGATNALKVHDNSTTEPTLWVGNKDTGATLHVKQEGTGNAAVFEGGSGVDISGVTGKAVALSIRSATDFSLDSAALHVKQEGTGNGALFEGGSGVDIKGVSGNRNALRIHGIDTDKQAIYVKQKGKGSAATFMGNVGIGTDPTKGKLEIHGGLETNFHYNAYVNENNYSNDDGDTKRFYSLHCSQVIAAAELHIISDERLKEVKGISNGSVDLDTLLRLEVTDYTFKDVVANGPAPQKKLIAQQVEKAFPLAVSRHTNVVPDIYQTAKIKDGWVTLATSLKKGDRVRLIGTATDGIHDVLEVGPACFRTEFTPEENTVFVYGREVNDFRTVDYEAIAMLNVSATQQIKKEKDAEVKALRQENIALRARLDALEAIVKALHGSAVPQIEALLPMQAAGIRSATHAE